MEKLSAKARTIVADYREGRSCAAIAKKVSGSVTSVQNVIQRLRRQGVDIPYRRGREDAVVAPQDPLFRFNSKTGTFKKVMSATGHKPMLTVLAKIRVQLDLLAAMLQRP